MGQHEVVAGLVVPAGGLVLLAPLIVDQGGNRVGEGAWRRVVSGGRANRVGLKHPVAAKCQEGGVDVARKHRELPGRRRVHVGPAVAPAAEEAPVLVDDDAWGHERSPGQQIGQPLRLPPVLAEEHRYRGRRLNGWTGASGASKRAAAG